MPKPPRKRLAPLLAKFALAAAALIAALLAIKPRPGLRAEFFSLSPGGAPGELLFATVEPPPMARHFISQPARRLPAAFRVLYSGHLRIKYRGTYFFWMETRGKAQLRLDGRPLERTNPEAKGDFFGYLDLAPGLHPFEIDDRFESPVEEGPALSVSWAKDIAVARSIPPSAVGGPAVRSWRFRAVAGIRWALVLLFLAGFFASARVTLAPVRYRRLCFRLGALILAAVTTLALGEIALRVSGVQPREYVPADIWLRYARTDWAPGTTTNYMGWLPYNVKEFDVPVTMNALGWRDRDYPYAKPAGTYRILVLGDSYVEGKEVALETTFHKLLEKRLNDTMGAGGRRFEVIALAKGGCGPVAEYSFLYDPGLLYDPDLVVLVFFPGNDVRETSAKLDEQYQHWLNETFYSKIITSKIDFMDRMVLADWSRFNRVVADRLCDLYLSRIELFRRDLSRADLTPIDIELYRRGPYDALWREAWDESENLIEHTRELAVKEGAEFLLMIAHSVQIPGVESDRLLGGAPSDLDILKPNRILAEFCRERGIELLDTESALSRFQSETGERYSWRFDAHWNENGHRVAADALYEYLRPRLLSRADP